MFSGSTRILEDHLSYLNLQVAYLDAKSYRISPVTRTQLSTFQVQALSKTQQKQVQVLACSKFDPKTTQSMESMSSTSKQSPMEELSFSPKR